MENNKSKTCYQKQGEGKQMFVNKWFHLKQYIALSEIGLLRSLDQIIAMLRS